MPSELPVYTKETDAELALNHTSSLETNRGRFARWSRVMVCLVFVGLALLSIPMPSFDCTGMMSGFDLPGGQDSTMDKDVCPQASPIAPLANSDLLQAIENEFLTETFRLKAYESLGGSVRIPYVCLVESAGLANPFQDRYVR